MDGLNNEGMAPELWLTDRERIEEERFKSERRLKEWRAARIALKQLLLQDGMITSPLFCEIRKNSLGQPRIVLCSSESGSQEDIPCSLAHKNHLVVAAYTSQRARVGIDIECRAWRLTYLRRRFESPQDRLLVSDDSIGRLTILWAFKEAVSKLVGLGFACGFTGINCTETRPGTCEINTREEELLYGMYVWHERYAIALVTDVPPPEGESPAANESSVLPWYHQLAKERLLRRARAIATSPYTSGAAMHGDPQEE